MTKRIIALVLLEAVIVILALRVGFLIGIQHQEDCYYFYNKSEEVIYVENNYA